jgi:hypothetical protein
MSASAMIRTRNSQWLIAAPPMMREDDQQRDQQPNQRHHCPPCGGEPASCDAYRLVFALYLMGLAIAAATSPSIDARFFWIWATVAVVGYMLSRGIAKTATRSRAHDPREDIDLGRD